MTKRLRYSKKGVDIGLKDTTSTTSHNEHNSQTADVQRAQNARISQAGEARDTAESKEHGLWPDSVRSITLGDALPVTVTRLVALVWIRTHVVVEALLYQPSHPTRAAVANPTDDYRALSRFNWRVAMMSVFGRSANRRRRSVFGCVNSRRSVAAGRQEDAQHLLDHRLRARNSFLSSRRSPTYDFFPSAASILGPFCNAQQ